MLSTSAPYGNFSWRIPSVIDEKKEKLIAGYTKTNYTTRLIDKPIIEVCIKYYQYSPYALDMIKQSKPDQVFISPTFCIEWSSKYKSFWCLELVPNYNGEEDIALFVSYQSDSEKKFKYSTTYTLSIKETGTTYTNYEEFINDNTSFGWEENMLPLKNIQSLNSLTMECKVELHENIKLNTNMIPRAIYQWNLNKDEIKQIKYGYDQRVIAPILEIGEFKWQLMIRKLPQNKRLSFYTVLLNVPKSSKIGVQYFRRCHQIQSEFFGTKYFNNNDYYISGGEENTWK